MFFNNLVINGLKVTITKMNYQDGDLFLELGNEVTVSSNLDDDFSSWKEILSERKGVGLTLDTWEDEEIVEVEEKIEEIEEKKEEPKQEEKKEEPKQEEKKLGYDEIDINDDDDDDDDDFDITQHM